MLFFYINLFDSILLFLTPYHLFSFPVLHRAVPYVQMYHVHGSFEILALTFLTKKYIGSENFTRNEIKKSEKLKTALKEVAKAAVIKTGLILRKNRAYIYGELVKIKKSLNVSPGLLGVKFPQVLCALSFAKKEIIMHFSYSNQIENERKDVQKYYNPQDYLASDVVPLLEIIFELIKFIEKYYSIVTTYNFEYLAINDCAIMKDFENKNVNTEETNIIKPYLHKMNEKLKIFVDGNKNKSDNTKSDNKINDKINNINNKTVVAEDKILFRYENDFKTLSILKIAKNKLYDIKNSQDNDTTENTILHEMKNEENLIQFRKSCTELVAMLTTVYNKQIRRIDNSLLENEEMEMKVNVIDIARKESISVFDKIYGFVYASYNRALLTTENSLFSLLKEYVIPYEICYFEREMEICFTDSLMSKTHTQYHASQNLGGSKSFKKINDFFSLKHSDSNNDDENKNKNNSVIYESESDKMGSFDITDYNDSGDNSPLTPTTPNTPKFDYNNNNNNSTISNTYNNNDDNNKNNSVTSIPSNKKNSISNITSDLTNGFVFFTLQSYSILNVHTAHRSEELINTEKTIKLCDSMTMKISLFVREKLQLFHEESVKLVYQTKQIEIANKIEQITLLKSDMDRAKKKRLSMFVFGGNLQTKNDRNDKNEKKEIINIFDYESNMNKMFQNPGEESKYTKKRENRGLLNAYTISELVSVKKKLSSLVITAQNYENILIFNKSYNMQETILNTILESTKKSLRNVFTTLKEKKTKNSDNITSNKENKICENSQIGEKIVLFLSVCRDSEYLFSFIPNADFFHIFRELLYGEDGLGYSVDKLATATSTHLSSLFPSLFPTQQSSTTTTHTDTSNNTTKNTNKNELENTKNNHNSTNISGSMKDIKHKYPLSFIGTGTGSGIDPNNAPLTPRPDVPHSPLPGSHSPVPGSYSPVLGTHSPLPGSYPPLPGTREVLAAAHIYLENCAKPIGNYSSKTVATTSIYYSDSNSPMRQRVKAESGGGGSGGVGGREGGAGAGGGGREGGEGGSVISSCPPSLVPPTDSSTPSLSSQTPSQSPSPTPSPYPVTPTSSSPTPSTLPSTSTSPVPPSPPMFTPSQFSPSPTPLPSTSPKLHGSGRLTRPLSLSHKYSRKSLSLKHFLQPLSNETSTIAHSLSTSNSLINDNQNNGNNDNVSLIELLSIHIIENILSISGISSKVASNMEKNTIFWIPSQKIFFSPISPCVFDKENVTELCRLIDGRGVSVLVTDIIELIVEKVSISSFLNL